MTLKSLMKLEKINQLHLALRRWMSKSSYSFCSFQSYKTGFFILVGDGWLFQEKKNKLLFSELQYPWLSFLTISSQDKKVFYSIFHSRTASTTYWLSYMVKHWPLSSWYRNNFTWSELRGWGDTIILWRSLWKSSVRTCLEFLQSGNIIAIHWLGFLGDKRIKMTSC